MEMNLWFLKNMLHSGRHAVRVESDEELQQLATDLSYDRAVYYCRYQEYDVYELIHDNQLFYSAPPEFILLQYRYARLDADGEAEDIQRYVVENRPEEKATKFQITRGWLHKLKNKLYHNDLDSPEDEEEMNPYLDDDEDDCYEAVK